MKKTLSTLLEKINFRILALVGGSGLVALWTVIRSLTNGVNFDVVGQIGVASQWAHGMHDGVQLGATNYLLKMPVYHLVNQLGFLSPHLKLLFLALLFNLITFVALVVLFEKILKLYKLKPNRWFYLGMLWLASISGRIFWLDYANSRNLEVAAGIVILYLGLVLLQKVSLKKVLLLIGFGAIVFFADQLQIYTIGGGLVLYALLALMQKRSKAQFRISSFLIGSILSAFVLAKLLLLAITHILPVSFLVAPNATQSLNFAASGTILHNLADSSARIFDASFYASNSSINSLRQGLNLLVLFALVGVLLYYVIRKRSKLSSLALVGICCIATSYLAYIASGQILTALTERYLIMVPLLLILVVSGFAAELKLPRLASLQISWLAIISVSAVLAFGALAISWPQRYSKDAYIATTLSFLRQNHYQYAATSRDGIPMTYFSNQRIIVTPFICQPDHRLVASNLFFDQAGFRTATNQTQPIPLLVPTGGIISSGSICDTTTILAQFGTPLAVQAAPNGAVLLYRPSQLFTK